MVVFNVEYHLSPEVKFPVAVNDAYAASSGCAAEAARFGVDPDRLVLAGDSAGANLVIVTSLQARDRRRSGGGHAGDDLPEPRPPGAAAVPLA